MHTTVLIFFQCLVFSEGTFYTPCIVHKSRDYSVLELLTVLERHCLYFPTLNKFDYYHHNQTLENVQSAKCNGITISDNMDWGQHSSEISFKTTVKTLGFLRRNLAFAPRSS